MLWFSALPGFDPFERKSSVKPILVCALPPFSSFCVILMTPHSSLFLADHELLQLPLMGKPWAASVERASQEQKMCKRDDWEECVQHPPV